MDSGITQDEALTINGQYTVQLTAGMSLQDASDKLNTVFSGNDMGMQASVVDNKLQIQSNFYGSSYGINITSSLDNGAGGTGLGGATAGTAKTVYGQNVAGTIDGQQATGWGQYLTSSAGDANGLKLQITGTTVGDAGVVKVSQGLASRLSNYCAQVTDPTTGLITRAANTISSDITDLNSQITTMTADVNTYTQNLEDEYATMEGELAQNQSTMELLTGNYSGTSGLNTSSTGSSSGSSSSTNSSSGGFGSATVDTSA